ncbi:CD1871A family CXXC motif-containing protein [Anaerococcus sp. NML200574]|uniref:CD1871A family CXXC motif-containing protein n=1 Tax=Anaerococcus kampingae TaxID=3115614 RepID=A0ABW9MB71_9FIRM|nr:MULTISPECIES: CD1871A family CXXC motif-containing protein [unclassified Anaerococcus]MCW6678363.1 CD1871A family CXXC motif-containing protein [Anaerococcus sp. NML200574]MCW6702049.1 CD1871A family CXXC motif-containing protein [Anaerococcus sp. NML200537]
MKKYKKSLAILALSLAFIGYGLYRKEADTVFMKAINLCLECIGIG